MSRKAAAASAEPPPSPAATGKFLNSRKRPRVSPGDWALAASAAFRMRLPPSSAVANGPSTLRSRASSGSSSTVSPTPAKATRLFNSWKPSARRPNTSNVRLSLAQAISRSAVMAMTPGVRHCPDYDGELVGARLLRRLLVRVGGAVRRLGLGGLLQTRNDLFVQQDDQIVLRLQRQ